MNPLDRQCDSEHMTTWQDVERAEPEFAQRVRGLFDAHRHKTIATLRADGSPRISGIEASFKDGELVFGSMPNARKGAVRPAQRNGRPDRGLGGAVAGRGEGLWVGDRCWVNQ